MYCRGDTIHVHAIRRLHIWRQKKYRDELHRDGANDQEPGRLKAIFEFVGGKVLSMRSTRDIDD
jgi:hypothetical protein